jgi:hypothetical protein
MPIMTEIALLLVVFVDLIGLGLVFSIINGLIMAPESPLLPGAASDAARHLDYGLVIGSFFLALFPGWPQEGAADLPRRCLRRRRAEDPGSLSRQPLPAGARSGGHGGHRGNQPIAPTTMGDARTSAPDRDRSMSGRARRRRLAGTGSTSISNDAAPPGPSDCWSPSCSTVDDLRACPSWHP